MKLVSFVSLTFALALTASAAQAQEQLEKKSEYYPLEIGTTWHYKLSDNSKFTMKVEKYEKVGDVMTALVVMSVDGKQGASENVYIGKDGVLRAAFDKKQAMPPVLFFKLPPKPDDTWTVDSKVGNETLKGTFKVGEEKEVTVPAGKYANVFKSSSEDMDAGGMKLSFTYYFAKDVGMIKQTIKMAGMDVEIVLEKFEPGNKK